MVSFKLIAPIAKNHEEPIKRFTPTVQAKDVRKKSRKAICHHSRIIKPIQSKCFPVFSQTGLSCVIALVPPLATFIQIAVLYRSTSSHCKDNCNIGSWFRSQCGAFTNQLKEMNMRITSRFIQKYDGSEAKCERKSPTRYFGLNMKSYQFNKSQPVIYTSSSSLGLISECLYR